MSVLVMDPLVQLLHRALVGAKAGLMRLCVVTEKEEAAAAAARLGGGGGLEGATVTACDLFVGAWLGTSAGDAMWLWSA